MPNTVLSFLSGRQITDDNGAPQAGALLYHYDAGTTNNLTVYSDNDGTVPRTQPVVCDAGGFVPLIYVASTSDWKVVVRTSGGVELHTYDNLAGAAVAADVSGFAAPLLSWNQITSSSSPVALTAADAGKAYEANTTAGNIEFDLPSAAATGNGKGFWFKKTASANSMVIDPAASETIDDVSTSFTSTRQYEVLGIFSNGAEWYAIEPRLPVPTVQRFTSGSGTYTPAQGVSYIKVTMAGGGGGGGAVATNPGTAGGTSTFGSWTAIGGNGGVVGTAASSGNLGGTGGTGGATGTGTLIRRVPGRAGGGVSATTGVGTVATFGGATALGPGGAGRFQAIGETGSTNTGAGGAGGSSNGVSAGSSGGGAEVVIFYVTLPGATSYAVGAGGTGGAAGTTAGGDGAAGVIIVEEYY